MVPDNSLRRTCKIVGPVYLGLVLPPFSAIGKRSGQCATRFFCELSGISLFRLYCFHFYFGLFPFPTSYFILHLSAFIDPWRFISCVILLRSPTKEAFRARPPRCMWLS